VTRFVYLVTVHTDEICCTIHRISCQHDVQVDMILDNQKEQLSLLRELLRQFAALTQKEYVEVVEDVLPKKLEAVAELEQFNRKLGDPQFKKQMVILLFMSFYLTCFFCEFYFKQTTGIYSPQNRILNFLHKDVMDIKLIALL